MSPLRAGAAFVLLPLAMLVERGAYYGMRSVLVLWLVRGGLPHAEAIEAARDLTALAMITPLGGALVAVAVGPHLAAAGGALLAVVGYGLLAGLEPTSHGVPLLLVALGTGLLRPGLLAAAGTAFPAPHETARHALFVLLYGAVQLGAAAISPAAAALGEGSGFRASFALSAALAALALVVVLAEGGVRLATRAAAPAQPVLDGRVPLGVAGLAAIVTPMWVAFELFTQREYDYFLSGAEPSTHRWVSMLNPGVVLLACALLAPLLGVLALRRKRVPALVPIGVGLALFGLFAVVAVVPVPFELRIPLLVVGLIGVSLGEALVQPFALSTAAGDAHPRLAPLLVAVYGLSSALPGWLAGRALADAPTGVSAALLLLSSGTCVVLGVALALLGRWLQRRVLVAVLPATRVSP